MHAFRCKNCGHLHPAEHAGENLVPHACVVCGKGVQHGVDFDALAKQLRKPGLTDEERKAVADQLAGANLAKTYQPDNWEVLANMSAKDLAKHGLKPADVTKHVPKKLTDPRGGKSVVATVDEGVGAKDEA